MFKPINQVERKVIVKDLIFKLSNNMNPKRFKMICDRLMHDLSGKKMAVKYKSTVGSVEVTLCQSKNEAKGFFLDDPGFEVREIRRLFEQEES